jgi:hypothetical protein
VSEDSRVPELWWSPTESAILRAGPGYYFKELPADAVRLVPESPKATGNRETDWQCPAIQPEHARLGRAQRCSLRSGHESPHVWVGKQGSLSTWEDQS